MTLNKTKTLSCILLLILMSMSMSMSINCCLNENDLFSTTSEIKESRRSRGVRAKNSLKSINENPISMFVNYIETAKIILDLNILELQSFLDANLDMKYDETLWIVVLTLAKVDFNHEKLIDITYYEMYLEHLISPVINEDILLTFDECRNTRFFSECFIKNYIYMIYDDIDLSKVILGLNISELQCFLDTNLHLKKDESLWFVVLTMGKIKTETETETEKLKTMSYLEIYMEHLISS